MKLDFKFEGVIFDIDKELYLKEQIRAAPSSPTRRQYLENQLSALYAAAVGMKLGSQSSNFKKL